MSTFPPILFDIEQLVEPVCHVSGKYWDHKDTPPMVLQQVLAREFLEEKTLRCLTPPLPALTRV